MYGNRGYDGWSMSDNARSAYDDGEMPKSKWTKTAIIDAIKGYCANEDLEYDAAVERSTKAELFSEFICWTSWHHTSKFYNETDFYGLDEYAVCERFPKMTEERANQAREERQRIYEAEKLAREERCAQLRRERELQSALQAKRQAERQAAEDAFEKAHGYTPDSLAAYIEAHPENVAYRTSLKGNNVIEIPDGYGLGKAMVWAFAPNLVLADETRAIKVYGFNALDE